MDNKLTKKYGLFTAICMVVGIVIGSGIFFKTKDVLAAANGNALYSVLAWIISGLIMVAIATTFGVMATKYEKVNGVVDYAEATCGKTYAYYVGWFMSLIYYPAMTSVLAWVSARYTLVLFGYVEAPLFVDLKSSLNSPECITLALFYLVLIYFLNTIAPKIAGKFQVSSTAVKLIPIVFIGIVGMIIGLFNTKLGANFNADAVADTMPAPAEGVSTGLFPAICGTIFAYEGWVVATTINSEIKNSKKNLPIALCLGTLIIVAAYTLYNVGILGLADISDVTVNGTGAAFAYFGTVGSKIIQAFIVISCLGTLNGLMLGCCRGIYSLSARDEGISPATFKQIDVKTNMPHNSAAFALLTCAVWFVYFILMGLGLFDFGVISKYGFDSSELPIITIYPLYVPILIVMMVKEKDLHPFKRFVLPSVSIVGVGIIVAASILKHKMANVWYLIVFAIIMGIGALVSLYNKKRRAGGIVGTASAHEEE
ncbi:MAG: APC family permease [Clostridia bacterium]|nr:APC family permease [Clostridia bacterium]